MKRVLSLVLLLCFGLFASTARAEFDELILYWQVSGSDSDFFNDAMAAVVMVYEGTGDAVMTGADFGPFAQELPAYENQVDLLNSISGINWDNAYFYVELFNESGEAFAASSVISFADIISNQYADWQSDDFHAVDSHMAAWRPTGYRAVPEPTSALLLVFGLAGLALRRKRV